MAEYKSKFTGAQIDEAINSVLNNSGGKYTWSVVWDNSAVAVKIDGPFGIIIGPINDTTIGAFDFYTTMTYDKGEYDYDMEYLWAYGWPGSDEGVYVDRTIRAYHIEVSDGNMYSGSYRQFYYDDGIENGGLYNVEYLVFEGGAD